MESVPITNATFNLTHNCNLRCSYCFTKGRSREVMPLEIGKKGIDFLIKNCREADIDILPGKKRSIDVSFWGGEPLLEWELLKDLVLYAEQQKENDIRVTFGGTTNGTLLTEDKLPFLADHKIFFMVSLDGTQETHDKYRVFKGGSGSHSLIMRNMEAVLKKWPQFKVRTSPYGEAVHRFYEDIKYLVDFGFNSIMFSPVYESGFTEENWKVWEEQCYKVVDLIVDYRKKGRKIEIEHFKSYVQIDNSKWPCGAGRFYVGFDIDGAIYPCHRFNKFSDKRNWREKEVCIGHLDHGITREDVREKFINYQPLNCGSCDFYYNTPCHGGCYAVNFDMTGDIHTAPKDLCRYVKLQKAVSTYYKEKIGDEPMKKGRPCVCYNLVYSSPEGEISDLDDSGIECHCYYSRYTGERNPNLVKKPGIVAKVTPQQVMDLLKKMDNRLTKIEDRLGIKEQTKEK